MLLIGVIIQAETPALETRGFQINEAIQAARPLPSKIDFGPRVNRDVIPGVLPFALDARGG